MSNIRLEEFNEVIVRTEPYFDHNDMINRISVDFISDTTKMSFKWSTSDFKEMVKHLNREVIRADKREYIP